MVLLCVVMGVVEASIVFKQPKQLDSGLWRRGDALSVGKLLTLRRLR